MAETGLPESRLIGERGRTIGQLGQFAHLIRKVRGWAMLDPADPEPKPFPKPDLRQMPGPGTGGCVRGRQFSLAFSTAGGDTASALAAGCQ